MLGLVPLLGLVPFGLVAFVGSFFCCGLVVFWGSCAILGILGRGGGGGSEEEGIGRRMGKADKKGAQIGGERGGEFT